MFNIRDLIYRVAHNYPGGVPALAVRMAMSPNVLNKKVSPAQEFHRLAVDELVELIEFSGDTMIADFFAELVGGVIVKTTGFDGVSDMALLETYTDLMMRLGEFSRDFHLALADGKVDLSELNAIQADLYHMQVAGATLLARLSTLREE